MLSARVGLFKLVFSRASRNRFTQHRLRVGRQIRANLYNRKRDSRYRQATCFHIRLPICIPIWLPRSLKGKPIAVPLGPSLFLEKALPTILKGTIASASRPTPKRQLMSQHWLLLVIGEIAFSLWSVLWCEEDRPLITKDDLTRVLVNCAPACYIAMSSSEAPRAARDINTIGIYR